MHRWVRPHGAQHASTRTSHACSLNAGLARSPSFSLPLSTFRLDSHAPTRCLPCSRSCRMCPPSAPLASFLTRRQPSPCRGWTRESACSSPCLRRLESTRCRSRAGMPLAQTRPLGAGTPQRGTRRQSSWCNLRATEASTRPPRCPAAPGRLVARPPRPDRAWKSPGASKNASSAVGPAAQCARGPAGGAFLLCRCRRSGRRA